MCLNAKNTSTNNHLHIGSLPHIIHESITLVVFLIRVVRFTAFFPPALLVCREEGIGLVGNIVHLGETKAVGKRDGLGIDSGSPDDIDFLIGSTMAERLLQ